MSNESRRLIHSGPNNFDAIRLAMALAVVWSHSFALYFGSEAAEPISCLMAGIATSGSIGVYVFFVVSGFLITQSFERSSSPWSYLRKRVARIYPGYIAATAICAFIVLPLYATVHYSLSSVTETVGKNLALLGWFVDRRPFTGNPITALNGSLWTIPYEFACYVGVLALGVLGLLKSAYRPLTAAALVLSICAHVGFDSVGWISQRGFKVLPCFLAGMVAYQYRDVFLRNALIAAGAIAVLICASHLHGNVGLLAVDALVPPTIAYATFMFAFTARTLQVSRYGDFSYGTYLYAFPIQQMIAASMGHISFAEFVALSVVLSICAGALSWYGVEQWFHAGRNRIPDRAGRTPGDPNFYF